MFKEESSSAPKTTDMSFEGEHPTPTQPNDSPFEGENPTPTEDEIPASDNGYNSPVDGEKEHTTDEDDQSELEEEVNGKLNPTYDPKYPPLNKWTKDHPKAQIIGDSSKKILTQSQVKAKQTSLFS